MLSIIQSWRIPAHNLQLARSASFHIGGTHLLHWVERGFQSVDTDSLTHASFSSSMMSSTRLSQFSVTPTQPISVDETAISVG